ncbi:hypothetical protein GCM10011613_02180 [Cellvibrio zantedeschiae]|uniref:STAS/SEC14 domain-containing protein n=1 Tax=Cellvibrio zantedeschiae TaxID=1237077 RepID=A0ABQ3AS59_9GAMM|nr:hypothetical protein [Cellvibrio zantedeschiae]GGY62280.1 hypothetical protein GCM10011613_02180 [Cellvibrio zantedeschiae]
MPNTMDITLQDNYLHVVISGSSTYDNAVMLWRTIADTCNQHNCFYVLGEQDMSSAISTMDAWNHQTIFEEAGITSKFVIAWVDKNPKTFEHTEFIRTVLANRNIGYGKLFSDTEKAKSWLLEKIASKSTT